MTVRSIRRDRSSLRVTLLLGSLVLLATFGCGGPPSTGGGAPSSTGDIPEITDDLINERINEAWVREVLEEKGTAPPISWNFDRDEPKQIVVVDKQVDGTRATIVLDIKTESSPRARAKRQLAGQIRTEWELRTGWVLRRWEIVDTENISMKYKNLEFPPGQNSNLAAPPGRNSNLAPPTPPNANR